jgi:hypothetical protein
LPYVLLDFWQVMSFIILGQYAFDANAYIWTDPSIYIPIVMIVTLAFYVILIGQLWLIQSNYQPGWGKTWFSFLN